MRLASAIVAALLLVGGAASVPVMAQEKENSLDRARINRLVQDLGSDNADLREEATRILRDIGAPALPALKDALKSQDAEVSYRAQRLIDEIERGGRGKDEPAEEEERKTQPHRKPPAGNPGANFSVTIAGNGQVTISRSANGHIRVSTKETKNGQEVEEVYEAESVREFIERYPEVARKYGIAEQGRGFTLPGFGGGPGGTGLEKELEEMFRGGQQEWMKELQEMLRDSRKNLQNMLKGFNERGRGSVRGFPWGEDPFSEDEEDGMPGLGDDDEDEGEFDLEAPRDEQPAPRLLHRTRLNDGLKVEFLSPALQAQLGLEGRDGVLVSEVTEGSAADQAGLKKYDVILKVSRRPVRANLEFRRILREAVESGELAFEIVRKGAPQTLEVTGGALEAFKK